MANKLKITQKKSKNGATKRQIANLQSLGLHKINQSVEIDANNLVSLGMLEKVRHLVTIEEI